MRRLVLLALVALATATAGVTAAVSSGTAVVDFGECAFGDGIATVAAGQPITLTDTGGFAQGTYGLALHSYNSALATATIIGSTTTTTIPLAYSSPQYIGDPFFAWLSFLQDVSLDPLASGESVLVTIEQAKGASGEIVFPRQKGPAPHFGPFHVRVGDTFEAQCLITAS